MDSSSSKKSGRYRCSVKVRGGSHGGGTSRRRQWQQLDGSRCVISADCRDLHFNGPRGMFSVSFAEVKDFQIKRGFMWANPGIEFHTYHGQRCKLNGFDNKASHKELLEKFEMAFSIVHRTSSYHSRSRRSWAEYQQHSKSSAMFMSCHESLPSQCKHSRRRLARENNDDNSSVTSSSAAGTIPAGEIQICQYVSEKLAPADISQDPQPRRGPEQKFDPGCHFVLKNISVEEYFDLFWSDGAEGFFLEEGLTLEMVSRWTDKLMTKSDKYDSNKPAMRRRKLHVVMPIEPTPLIKMPPTTRVHCEQWIRQWPSEENGGVLIIETASKALDVPFGSTFESIDHWTARPVPGHRAIRVEYQASCSYKSRFSFARTFRSHVIADCKKFATIFAQHAKAFTAQHVEENRRQGCMNHRSVRKRSMVRTFHQITAEPQLRLPIQSVAQGSNVATEASPSFRSLRGTASTASGPVAGILSPQAPPRLGTLTSANLNRVNRHHSLLSPRRSHNYNHDADPISPCKKSSVCEVENVVGGDLAADIAPAWTCARVLYSTIAATRI